MHLACRPTPGNYLDDAGAQHLGWTRQVPERPRDCWRAPGPPHRASRLGYFDWLRVAVTSAFRPGLFCVAPLEEVSDDDRFARKMVRDRRRSRCLAADA